MKSMISGKNGLWDGGAEQYSKWAEKCHCGCTPDHPSARLAAGRRQDTGYWRQDPEGRILNAKYRPGYAAG